MNVPDYVSPVVAYRAWLLGLRGLSSLNGEFWHPNQKLQAFCVNRHTPPHGDCSCAIYAAKSFDHLRGIGFDQLRVKGYAELVVHGEVYLWGTVVEHQLGWRAQFAYPKTLVVSPELVLRDLCTEKMESLEILIGYGADLFVAGEKGTVPLWTKQCRGLDRRELAARLWQSHHSERLEGFAAVEALEINFGVQESELQNTEAAYASNAVIKKLRFAINVLAWIAGCAAAILPYPGFIPFFLISGLSVAILFLIDSKCRFLRRNGAPPTCANPPLLFMFAFAQAKNSSLLTPLTFGACGRCGSEDIRWDHYSDVNECLHCHARQNGLGKWVG